MSVLVRVGVRVGVRVKVRARAWGRRFVSNKSVTEWYGTSHFVRYVAPRPL